MSREADLLDALEDAQEELARHQRQLRWGLGLFFGGLMLGIGYMTMLSLLSSLGQNWGNASGFPAVVLVIVAIVGAVVTGGTWFDDLPKSRKALKKAQRAHRNYMINN